MNNDIKYEVVKYLTETENSEDFNKIIVSKEHRRRNLYFMSNILDRKLKNRPSLEELKNKNIIRNELISKEIKEELKSILVNKNSESGNSGYIAPSISNLVKKMNFEYKKIVIIHKMNNFKK